MPNWLLIVTSIGYGVLLSLAIAGGARLVTGLLGTPLSPETAGNVFGASALLLCPLAAYFKVALLVVPVVPLKAK